MNEWICNCPPIYSDRVYRNLGCTWPQSWQCAATKIFISQKVRIYWFPPNSANWERERGDDICVFKFILFVSTHIIQPAFLTRFHLSNFILHIEGLLLFLLILIKLCLINYLTYHKLTLIQYLSLISIRKLDMCLMLYSLSHVFINYT